MDRQREETGELAPGTSRRYKVRKVGRHLLWRLREVNMGSQENQVSEGRASD